MTNTNENRPENLDKILKKEYSRSVEPLTPIEALTALSILYLTRKKQVPCVTVNELARYMGKSESRIRVILNNMKRKGAAIDIVHPLIAVLRERESYEQLLQRLPEAYTELEEIAGIRINIHRGGQEKCWTLTEVDPLDDKGVIEYLEEKRPEILKVHFPRMTGKIYEEIRGRVYRFLGIKDYK